MIDLDYFKQVNDNFGHIYGDIVLRSLAIRLENTCSAIIEEEADTIEMFCARPSGEEFIAVVSGRLPPDREIAVAERIRSAVADLPLPSEEEWKLVSRDMRDAVVQLPHLSDRRVTASIGLTSVHPQLSPSGIEATVEELKTQADLAVYRAKASGRNQCVKYVDILARYGRVLEHHPETGVVSNRSR